MKHLDEQQLQSDCEQRYAFLSEFIQFGAEDVRRIQASAPHIGPRIGEMVDKTYTQLLAFDATAKHFLPKQHGFEGESPTDLTELNANHPQIQFRKDHLNRYFVALIGRAYDGKMIQYLDMVGKIHTPQAGNREINVPLYQMNALLGLLSDIITEVLIESPLNTDDTLQTIRAFQKLLWIQNDFISRHYQPAAAE